MKRLSGHSCVAAALLEFTILTASRSGESLGGKWSEIDTDGKVWTVPADRMKAAREDRVPLSGRALTILDEIAKARRGEYVFPALNPDEPLSGMAMEMLLRRMEVNVGDFTGSDRASAIGAATKRLSRARLPKRRSRIASATRRSKPIGVVTRLRSAAP